MINKVNHISRSIIYRSQMNFTDIISWGQSMPIKDRVMSTPRWPVPYYQRVFKAYPFRQVKSVDISQMDFPASDCCWMSAKLALNESLRGRQIVNSVQKNAKIKTYLIKKNDCGTMVKAYVDDIAEFLNLANAENVRILGDKTLI